MSLGAAFLTVAVAAVFFAGRIYHSEHAATVQVWLDRSGNPQAPPPSTDSMFFTALFTGITVTAGATVALILCYLFCRATLDRHRLARWESAWPAVGPRWTSRR